MTKMISSDACRKYAEICKYRHSRLLNIQESALFESLEKVCLQAAEAADRAEERLQPGLDNYDGPALAQKIMQQEAKIRLLINDIEAYRGALGYPVPGEYDDRLSDGTIPKNGIAEALHAEIERLRVRLAVLDGTTCAEEQQSGDGPCGVCTSCLRAESDRLRQRLAEAKALLRGRVYSALTAPLDDWKGHVERAALDGIRAFFAQEEQL